MNRSSPPRSLLWAAALSLAATLAASAAPAAPKPAAKPPATPAGPSLPIEEHVLSNGMKLVLIPQHLSPTVSGA